MSNNDKDVISDVSAVNSFHIPVLGKEVVENA